jgi:hypothetical protein
MAAAGVIGMAVRDQRRRLGWLGSTQASAGLT